MSKNGTQIPWALLWWYDLGQDRESRGNFLGLHADSVGCVEGVTAKIVYTHQNLGF